MPNIYKTPPCPCCQSENTGLLLTNMSIEDKIQAMRKGVNAKSRDITENNNLFCGDCKHRFRGQIETANVSDKEYNDRLSARGIDKNKLHVTVADKPKKFRWLKNMLPDFSDMGSMFRDR